MAASEARQVAKPEHEPGYGAEWNTRLESTAVETVEMDTNAINLQSGRAAQPPNWTPAAKDWTVDEWGQSADDWK